MPAAAETASSRVARHHRSPPSTHASRHQIHHERRRQRTPARPEGRLDLIPQEPRRRNRRPVELDGTVLDPRTFLAHRVPLVLGRAQGHVRRHRRRQDARGAPAARHALVPVDPERPVHPAREGDGLGEEAVQPVPRRAVPRQLGQRRACPQRRAGVAPPAHHRLQPREQEEGHLARGQLRAEDELLGKDDLGQAGRPRPPSGQARRRHHRDLPHHAPQAQDRGLVDGQALRRAHRDVVHPGLARPDVDDQVRRRRVGQRHGALAHDDRDGGAGRAHSVHAHGHVDGRDQVPQAEQGRQGGPGVPRRVGRRHARQGDGAPGRRAERVRVAPGVEAGGRRDPERRLRRGEPGQERARERRAAAAQGRAGERRHVRAAPVRQGAERPGVQAPCARSQVQARRRGLVEAQGAGSVEDGFCTFVAGLSLSSFSRTCNACSAYLARRRRRKERARAGVPPSSPSRRRCTRLEPRLAFTTTSQASESACPAAQAPVMVTRIPRHASYRRRPPRSPLVVLISLPTLIGLALALLTPYVAAQTSTSISDPSTTTVQLDSAASAFFHLASPSSSPIWVSLSLCAPPPAFASSTNTSTLPYKLGTALYLSNSSSIQAPGPDNTRDPDDGNPDTPRLDSSTGATAKLSHGFANATLDGAADGGLWIGIVAPDSAALLDGVDNATATAGEWVFELQVSSGTPLAPYAAEAAAGLRLGDTDSSTVLLTTANYTAAARDEPDVVAAAPDWQVLVAPTEPHAFALGRSQYAVRAAMQRAVGRANASATTRGYGGGTRTQFVIDGLEPATNYTAWLVANETMVGGTAGEENQTRVWDPSFFATKSGDSCRLVFDIDACPSVAYSVPSPRSLDTDSLVSFFNSTISASLANFSRTLTTFPCGSRDNGLYSIVSTCDDCLEAFRTWLCATTLPRCTDAPPSTALNDSTAALARNNDELASWFVPQQFETALVRDDPAASRTPLFGPANLSTTFPSLFNASYPATAAHARAESPFPYSEVPPCLDVCNLVEARCPPFLGWRCPRGTVDDVDGGTGSAAYGVTREVPKGERQADDLPRSSLGARAADRFGNVFCNALDSDLVQAAQFVPWTYARSSAASSHASPAPLFLLLSVSTGLRWLLHL